MNDDERFDPAPTAEPDTSRFPWPPAEGESIPGAFVQTWREASLEPRRFFRAMPTDGPIGPALLYYLVIGVVAAAARLLWTLLGFGFEMERDAVLGEAPQALHPLVEFLLSPLLLVAVFFAAGAIVHLLLRLFGGANGRLNTTLRVSAFAYSPAVLEWVPFIGGLAGTIWTVVVLVIGLREAHATSTGRVLAAVLLPLFFLVILLAVLTFIATAGHLLLPD